jgi:hypothetical protein
MTRLTEHPSSLAGRIRNLAHTFVAVLASVILAGAWIPLAGAQTTTQMTQTTIMTQGTVIDSNDPNTWPATFNGNPDMGPYAWVDGPTHLQQDPQLANVVVGGQEGTRKLYVCRVRQQDGVHPGKYFDGHCNMGWGGQELSLTQGYELLVNTQPQNAKFLSQQWMDSSFDRNASFWGGSVGTTQMRVCQTWWGSSADLHPGKEWEGKCNIGYGGKEVSSAAYRVLSLGFEKAAWQADPISWPATFNGNPDMGPYAWVDGPTEINSANQLSRAVSSDLLLGDGTRLYVCRARMSDGGTHPGKFFNGMCNVGWGGAEKSLTSGYELLVNTKPEMARFLSQTWLNPASAPVSATFQGGSVGTTPMRVARAAYIGGWHLGKEWEGKCNIGYDGKEVAEGVYQVLSLGFDRAAWQATQTTQTSTSGGTWYQQVTVTTQPLTLSPTTSTTTITPATGIDTTNYVAKMLADFNAAYTYSIKTTWTPGALGTGLSKVAGTLPDLMYSMIDHYNEKQTDPAKRKDRTTVFNGLQNGDAEAQSFMIFLMADRAKSILDRDPATWTTDETGFIHFLQALAHDQRIKAAGQAKQEFEAWKVYDREQKSVGLLALSYTPSKPPPEFLAKARSGYAVTPELAPNFGRIIATSAGLLVAAGYGLSAALSGVGVAMLTSISASLSAGAALHSMVGTQLALGAGVSAGFGATVAVVALMVTAGIVKGIELAEYDQYVRDMDAAIADSKNPVDVAQLKSLMSTGDGVTRMVYWLAAQAATGTK